MKAPRRDGNVLLAVPTLRWNGRVGKFPDGAIFCHSPRRDDSARMACTMPDARLNAQSASDLDGAAPPLPYLEVIAILGQPVQVGGRMRHPPLRRQVGGELFQVVCMRKVNPGQRQGTLQGFLGGLLGMVRARKCLGPLVRIQLPGDVQVSPPRSAEALRRTNSNPRTAACPS